MRIALLADIHANLDALEAVLHDCAAVDAERLVCLGDVVGYGAQPHQCSRLLRELGCRGVMGNHDFYTVSPTVDATLAETDAAEDPLWAGILHARKESTPEDLDWLEGLTSVGGVDGALIAHAALHDFDDWPYLRSLDAARPTLRLLGERVGFFGHTHRQRIFHVPGGPAPEPRGEGSWRLPENAGYAVTAGSIGQSRDEGAEATWTMWEPETRTVTFRRVSYDYEAAANRILRAGLPARSAMRLLP